METIILIVHVLAAIAIVALVLLQQGKGADAGASFGGGSGASQTVFGSQGGSSFFGRLTAFFALVFFLTSFALAFVASEKANSISGAVDFIPAAIEDTNSVDIPQLGTDQVSESTDLPSVD
ncbi:preprotein translocase subunit SecG [Marinomonas sp. 15G1-11]|uniref:Protein-export membrane protein SecG n=1 Tax=Marinomonas phaeophyticola TaxID=3004091 RepID=A0ABT4JRX0_9GAMM|nr:preprotein translocase subunit SecG [Marinomonas sp. 15G1-11]MCZ2721135.1 preprotein translocase subunit SecG [Marinomonas sp. 15G1-11]